MLDNLKAEITSMSVDNRYIKECRDLASQIITPAKSSARDLFNGIADELIDLRTKLAAAEAELSVANKDIATLEKELASERKELSALREDKALEREIRLLSTDGFETSPAAQYQEALWNVVNPTIPFDPEKLHDVAYLHELLCATVGQKRQAIDSARSQNK